VNGVTFIELSKANPKEALQVKVF